MIDIYYKSAELIYKKLLIFLAIAGGSWIYAIKADEFDIFAIVEWIAFVLSTIGIIINLAKYGKFQNKLEELENDSK